MTKNEKFSGKESRLFFEECKFFLRLNVTIKKSLTLIIRTDVSEKLFMSRNIQLGISSRLKKKQRN